jgi:hypothetical protein
MMDDANELQIAVLLDWQNVYNGAREAFDLHALGHIAGNVDPWQWRGGSPEHPTLHASRGC